MVTYTIAAAGSCALFTATTMVTITAAPNATIAYTGSPYCSNVVTATVTRVGASGGTYSSTAGLIINATTGDINIATSTAGTYTVTYTVAAAGGCSLFTTTTSITITTAPNATISYGTLPFCSNSGTANALQEAHTHLQQGL
jgi:large repetitive protein